MPEKMTKREKRSIEKQRKRRKYLKITIGVVVGILIVASCAWAVITYSPYLFGNKTPIADAGANQTADVGIPVLFNGAGKDSDGKIALYEWDFDNDGIYEYSNKTTGSATHTYNETGVYTACLRVTDDKGATDTDEMCVYCVGTIIQIETNRGTIKIGLYDDNTPITTANSVSLAQSGFYNGTIFHRVANLDPSSPDTHIIQGGGFTPDMQQKTSAQIQFEYDPDITHVDGAVAMASTGAKVGGTCQFYICDGPQHFLDGNYAVFGQVIDGMDVVRQIASVQTQENVPVEDVIITGVTISE
ncbi:MAG: peptidylprolyl isomerase [Candidatus Thermoplasmatota archaeon]|nr:peptidylprolyl isomerase [Candidatus Thermoplasmatota archaeon]